MEIPKLPHSGHNKHLCYLVNLGMQQRQPARFKKMLRDPTHVCRQCGRAANNPKNLCKPVKL